MPIIWDLLNIDVWKIDGISLQHSNIYIWLSERWPTSFPSKKPSLLDGPPKAGGYFLPHVRPKTWFIVPGVDARIGPWDVFWIANGEVWMKGVVENGWLNIKEPEHGCFIWCFCLLFICLLVITCRWLCGLLSSSLANVKDLLDKGWSDHHRSVAGDKIMVHWFMVGCVALLLQ